MNAIVVVVIIISISVFYYVLLKDLRKYLSRQKEFGYEVIKEYKGIRLMSQGFVSLSNYQEFLKHYYRTGNMNYVAFMLEIFCYNIRIITFLIIEIIILLVMIVISYIYIKDGRYMSILFVIFFLLVLFYLLYYCRNEEFIEINDRKFLQYLKDNNDDKTIDKIKKKVLNINKAKILIDRYYETGDTNYLAYAIQDFTINGYLYTIIIGVISLVFSALLFILLYNIFK